AVLRAVDAGFEPEAEALPPERVCSRSLGDGSAELDRLGHSLDRELARAFDTVAVTPLERGGAKGDLGIAGGVEEVRRLEMAVQLVVFHIDTRDLRRSLERRLLAAGEDGLEIGEAAAECVHPGVAHLERDVRVDGIRGPRAGGSKSLCAFGD